MTHVTAPSRKFITNLLTRSKAVFLCVLGVSVSLMSLCYLFLCNFSSPFWFLRQGVGFGLNTSLFM